MQCIVMQLLHAPTQRSSGTLQRLHCYAGQDGGAYNNGRSRELSA